MTEPTPSEKGFSSLEKLFLTRTTLARLLLALFLVGGLVGYNSMIKESLPDIDIATAVIETVWPGGDSRTIEQEITNVFERELKNLKGLKTIQSGSFSGKSVIIVEFDTDSDSQDAMARLQGKVAEVQGQLPDDSERPTVRQVSVNDRPVFSISLYGEPGLQQISLFADRLKQLIEKISGINEVSVSGGLDAVIDVRLIGARLSALGISPSQVKSAIQSANIDVPLGQFDGERLGATFRLTGRYRDVAQLRELPIRRLNDRIVRLDEIAQVRITSDEERTRTFYAQGHQEFRRSVSISVTKQPGADAIAVVDQIKDLITRERGLTTWPADLEYAVVVDAASDIKADLSSVFVNGLQAMIAVFIVLFVSLTWREALVAGLAIPVAFSGAMMALAFLGHSINQLVIVGMVIALGLLVDVFILMMEGMHENIFVKKRSFEASAVQTARTYAVPALSGQLTTILAMSPLLAIAGLLGLFIRPIPMTAIACLVAAYIVALLMTISLSRYVLPKSGEKVSTTYVDHLTSVGSAKLEAVLRSRFLPTKRRALQWVLGTVAVFLLSGFLFTTLPTELMPKDDGRNLGVLVELEPETSLSSAQQCADAVGDKLNALEYFESVTKYVGEKSPFTSSSLADKLSPTRSLNFVGFTTVFVPLDERDKLGYEYLPEIAASIEGAMRSCAGGYLLLTPSLGGASDEAPIQIQLLGDDMDRLRSHADDLVELLARTNGAANPRHNLGLPVMDIQAAPKMDALNFYGVNVADMSQQLRFMTSSDTVGQYIRGDGLEDIDIKMGFGWPSRQGQIGGPTGIGETYLMNIATVRGESIPLMSLVELSLTQSPLAILHTNGNRAVTVLADTQDRTAEEVLESITPMLEQWRTEWPENYTYQVGGEAESGAEVFGSAGVMLVLALLLVFSLLVLQFDSFSQPFIIMSSIPLALTGTFLGFFLLGIPFSFMMMVGIISLIGIVVNDAIVMIETMNSHRDQGLSIADAAARGAAERLRPILTTSITTIVGMIPLAFSGAKWLPLSLTLITGLLFATLLALLIVPCLYMLFSSHEKPVLS
ncbi:MAG: efflux RND transporter permease subunit [Pseudomonadota bacterium]